MKAITLWRPWSDAIVYGPKRVENRTWLPPTTVIGERIAIHAGKRFDHESFFPDSWWPPEPDDSPMGILGTARLIGCRSDRGHKKLFIHSTTNAELLVKLCCIDKDEWYAGPVGWLFDSVRPFQEPIECNGAQGLWTVPSHLDEVVAAADQQVINATGAVR